VIANELAVDVLPDAVGVKDVALGDDAGTGLIVVDHDGGADAARGHSPGGFAQRMLRTDGHDDRVHSVSDAHGSPPCR
jgi:hypothetical protein